VFDDANFGTAPLEHAKVDGRISPQRGWIAEQQDADIFAAVCEMSSDDEAVTTIISATSTDHDATGNTEFQKPVNTAAARVFHQDNTGQAVVFNRSPIHIAHLIARHHGGHWHGGLRKATGGPVRSRIGPLAVEQSTCRRVETRLPAFVVCGTNPEWK
jgi:hypothetical protein